MSKETISGITDKVIEEMTGWCNRSLDVHAAGFIAAVVVQMQMGRSPTGPPML